MPVPSKDGRRINHKPGVQPIRNMIVVGGLFMPCQSHQTARPVPILLRALYGPPDKQGLKP